MKKYTAILIFALAALFSVNVFAAGYTDVTVEPGYDYGRFKDEGITLNVYNWGEYISTGADDSLDVNKAFEELTGIKVHYTTFAHNEEMHTKISSGSANYDIIIPSDYMIGRMINEELILPLNFDNIPNYSKIGQQYKNLEYDPENKYSVPYTWGYVGLIYNTQMVDKPVDSWDILWDEEYSGEILMFENSRDAFAIASLKLGLPMNPTSIEEVDMAANALREQNPLVQTYVMDQIFDKMEGSEAALAPYYAGDAIMMIDANPDLAFTVPKEGTNYFIDAMCIPYSTTNKEAAEMYINFMCETQVAIENSLAIGYSTPQLEAEAALPEEIKNNPIAYPPPEILENTWVFNVLPDNLAMHMDTAWNNIRATNSKGNSWMMFAFLIIGFALAIFVSVRKKIKKKRENY